MRLDADVFADAAKLMFYGAVGNREGTMQIMRGSSPERLNLIGDAMSYLSGDWSWDDLVRALNGQ